MLREQIELTVLVKGRPITEYQHAEHVFVEGRAGSEYELEVRNHTNQRIEAVLSVDGLSVIDGKLAGAHSRGYLIGPRDVIRIPGWTLDASKVAKFAFAGKQASYATQMTGDARNNGVIGVMAYREKIDYMPYIFCSTGLHGIPISDSWNGSPGVSASTWDSASRGIAPTSSAKMSRSMSSNSASAETKTSGGMPHNVMAQQSLGTAFGESQTFTTSLVTFQRGGVICTMVIGYDEKRGLRSRGIAMPRKRHVVQTEPQAFPAMAACQPPPGWRG